MSKYISVVAALALGALAQSTQTTVTYVNPGYATTSTATASTALQGQVLSVTDGATVYALQCASGQDVCPTGTPIGTLTAGPSTFHYVYTTSYDDVAADFTEACAIQGTSSAECTVGYSYSVDGTAAQSSTTVTYTDLTTMTSTLPIVSGASLLSAATASSTSTASSSASRSSVGGGVAVLYMLPALAVVAGGLMVLL